jgi:hypothetical protein
MNFFFKYSKEWEKINYFLKIPSKRLILFNFIQLIIIHSLFYQITHRSILNGQYKIHLVHL